MASEAIAEGSLSAWAQAHLTTAPVQYRTIDKLSPIRLMRKLLSEAILRCAPVAEDARRRRFGLRVKLTPFNRSQGVDVPHTIDSGPRVDDRTINDLVSVRVVGGREDEHPSGQTRRLKTTDWRRRLWYRRFAFVVALLGVLSVVASLPAAASPRPIRSATDRADEWKSLSPINQARSGSDVATAGGHIYVVGGFILGGPSLGSVESRSVQYGPWRSAPPLPTPLSNSGVAASDGLIYNFGGILDDDSTTADVDVYAPESRRWTPRRPMPQPLDSMGAASSGGLVYLAGGFTDQVTPRLLIYNPRSDSWRIARPMPTPRDRLRLVAAGPYLYAIGGQNAADASLSVVERYDIKRDIWAELPPLHQSRTVPCVVSTHVGHRAVLVVVGGGQYDQDGNFVQALSSTEVYDIADGRWIQLTAQLPTGRASFGCALDAHGAIVAVAGTTAIGGTFKSVADVDSLLITPRMLDGR